MTHSKWRAFFSSARTRIAHPRRCQNASRWPSTVHPLEIDPPSSLPVKAKQRHIRVGALILKNPSHNSRNSQAQTSMSAYCHLTSHAYSSMSQQPNGIYILKKNQNTCFVLLCRCVTKEQTQRYRSGPARTSSPNGYHNAAAFSHLQYPYS